MQLFTVTNQINIDKLDNQGYSNKTYKMEIEKEQIHGVIENNIECVKQAVYKILNTERFKHCIYTWDYGVELQELFNKPLPYVIPEIPRRIEQALLYDDRIKKVDNFKIKNNRDGVVVADFTVHTIYGDFEYSKGVSV